MPVYDNSSQEPGPRSHAKGETARLGMVTSNCYLPSTQRPLQYSWKNSRGGRGQKDTTEREERFQSRMHLCYSTYIVPKCKIFINMATAGTKRHYQWSQMDGLVCFRGRLTAAESTARALAQTQMRGRPGIRCRPRSGTLDTKQMGQILAEKW